MLQKSSLQPHATSSTNRRRRAPLAGFTIAKNPTRPAKCCRKLGWPVRFWLSPPRRRQFVNVAFNRSNSIATHVQPLIGHQTRQVLPHTLTHHARLAMVDDEALLGQNHGHMRSKPQDAALPLFVARKRQVRRPGGTSLRASLRPRFPSHEETRDRHFYRELVRC